MISELIDFISFFFIPQKEDMNSSLLATNLSEVLLKGINK